MIPVTVELIMTRKVFNVGMDDAVGVIRKFLDKVHFHHLLVVERNKLNGVISDQ
jgi:acetoin utilization protein AcuB